MAPCLQVQRVRILANLFLFTDYPHMHIPWRNCMIRLLLPYQGADKNLAFRCLCLREPMRDPNQPFGPPSHSLPFFTLCSSSSSPRPNRIAHFSVDKRVWKERVENKGEKKQYKLSKSHWPTSADVSLGIHISVEELEAEIPPHLHHFSRHPLLFLFQLEAIFLRIPCLILCYHDSAFIQVDKRFAVA